MATKHSGSSDLGETLSQGIDQANRTIFLVGQIEAEMAARFMVGFRALDAGDGPIRLILNSSGGSEPEGFAMYDMMKLARNEVVVDCYGVVQSIAALVLQAADRRRLSPECRFMVHNGHLELSGAVYQGTVVSVARESALLTARYQELLAERAGLTVQQVKTWCDRERYFSATEAVDLGFADEVINTAEKVELPRTKRRASASTLPELAEVITEIDLKTIEKVLRRKPKRKRK